METKKVELTFWRRSLFLHKAWLRIQFSYKDQERNKPLTPSSINCVAQLSAPVSMPSPTTTNYFDLSTDHNISHLLAEAIVSGDYSSQQDKHHVGQCTQGTICCINNTPCQLSRLGYGWMNTAKPEPVSDASLCIIRVVTLSLLTVRSLSDLIQKNGL